jgi:C-8 sterol isomerase
MTTVFDPEQLHAIAREHIGVPIEQLLPRLHHSLRERYGDHIAADPPWMFNNAGGAMGTMWVLHFSITEYLIVFGSPIGTEGHSGRFYADDWFCILDGEQWAYGSGDLERQVFRPGDMHHMPRGTARGYRIPDHCWALEYARGIIPTMLPFGVADVLSSTLDLRTLGRTMGTAAKSVVRELLRGKI